MGLFSHKTAFALATGVAALLAAAPSVSTVTSTARLEAQVFAALNEARTEPQAQLGDLETYRRNFHGKIVTMPGTRITYRTSEGTAPVDEALTFLSNVSGRQHLLPSDLLAAAAADHVAEQSRSGQTGHYGSNGSGPSGRVLRRGGGPAVTEVIAYGALDAADVVRQLIVDDGVAARGHRSAVFAARLQYAGVACGPHPIYRTMCVIDMADTPDGWPAQSRTLRLRTEAGG